ncbi:MAG: molecular chaperone GrpE [Rhodobacteraceae bacterium HLUCCA08]|nr:MAG: molecular chaperone GrpE [Rhodobacteraceae bacterium HLUCCA08]
MAERKTEQEMIEDILNEEGLDTDGNPVDGPEDEVDPIDQLRAENADLKDAYMRALADAENTRKRAQRDKREAEAYGATRLGRDLLPVYDNLDRALKLAKEDGKDGDKALLEGVELTMRELLNVFKRHGIEPILPEIGERFDPQLHEAMFEAPVPGTKAGDILQVSAAGFLLHDRLLRPAQVGVSSTPAS